MRSVVASMYAVAGLVVGLVLTICSLAPAQKAPLPQAVAPKSLLAITLADLQPGQRAYVLPEALQIDRQSLCWLDLSAVVQAQATGLLAVRQVDDTWAVAVQRSGLRWRTMSVDTKNPLVRPVVSLTVPAVP